MGAVGALYGMAAWGAIASLDADGWRAWDIMHYIGWGLGGYCQPRGRRLARLGYCALYRMAAWGAIAGLEAGGWRSWDIVHYIGWGVGGLLPGFVD